MTTTTIEPGRESRAAKRPEGRDELKGLCVALSGAIPEPEQLAEHGWSELDIRTVVSYLVDAVLRQGGTLVHGSHPTYQVLIQAAARLLAVQADGEPAAKRVHMLVVGPHVTREEVQALHREHGSYALVEVIGPCRESDWSEHHARSLQHAWLQIMRERMADLADALVCVGGKGVRPDVPRPGVAAEAELVSLARKPVFFAAAFGGYTRQVSSDAAEPARKKVPNGLSETENAELGQEENPFTAVALILRGLRNIQGAKMENKRKHLDMIQAIVSRLAGNSFMLKGWSVTLVSALFAFAAKDSRPAFVLLALFPALVFWCLDGYFLQQERTFRALFDVVRRKSETEIDYSMNPQQIGGEAPSWEGALFSKTILLFHGAVLAVIVVVAGALCSDSVRQFLSH